MNYVKANGGVIEKFPYSLRELKKDNPLTSFPKAISNEMLMAYGVYPVSVGSAPLIDQRLQKTTLADLPQNVAGEWVLNWLVSDKSQEEIDLHSISAANKIRSKRNGLLDGSDWTQIADAPVDAAAWAVYRQALRDITNHVNFPHLAEGDWPAKP